MIAGTVVVRLDVRDERIEDRYLDHRALTRMKILAKLDNDVVRADHFLENGRELCRFPNRFGKTPNR